MPIAKQKIMPCLWFDNEGEAAAKHYVSIFKNSKIGRIGRYSDAGKEIHGKPAGAVMTVEFELEGQQFLALNGGPQFKFDEAISFQVFCDTQAEVDYFWSKLSRAVPKVRAAGSRTSSGSRGRSCPGGHGHAAGREIREGRARVRCDHADEEDRYRGAEKAYAG